MAKSFINLDVTVLEKVKKILKDEDWRRFVGNTRISAYIVNSQNKQKIGEKLKEFGFSYKDCYFCYEV